MITMTSIDIVFVLLVASAVTMIGSSDPKPGWDKYGNVIVHGIGTTPGADPNHYRCKCGFQDPNKRFVTYGVCRNVNNGQTQASDPNYEWCWIPIGEQNDFGSKCNGKHTIFAPDIASQLYVYCEVPGGE